jgi:isoleucyl-tRNA synthetase
VHLELFPTVDRLKDEALMARWDALLEVREQVNAALEQKRKDKVIGNSLTAHVTCERQGGVGPLLEQYRDTLPMLFIVSDFELNVGAAAAVDGVDVVVDKARGSKCERWLAVCAQHPSGLRLGRPVRPLCGRAGRAGAPVAAL